MPRAKPTPPTNGSTQAHAVSIDDVHADPANARVHGERNKATIRASLARFGPGRSIVLDGNNVVRAGNGTIEEARLAGFDEVLVVEPKPNQLVAVKRADWSATEAAAYAIADNRASEQASWNDEALATTLQALQGDSFDLGTIGYSDDELDALLEGIANQALANGTPAEDPGPQIDRADELQKKWGTQLGQLWLIPSKTASGDHRLLCGDSRALLRTIADDSIAMVFTDPPYGHNNNNNDLIHRREAALGRLPSGSDLPQGRPIANDGPEANDLLRDVLPDFKRVLLAGGCCCCCCCCGGGPDPQFARWSLWIDEIIPFKMCIVWDKGGLGMGWHYRRCWECVLVAEKPGAACKWYGGNDVPNIIRDVGKIIPSKDEHPTLKPVELPTWFIELHSQPGELVLDPFLGSGTTIVAAEQTGRLARGIEIAPKYVAVALERLAGLGLSPVLSGAAS